MNARLIVTVVLVGVSMAAAEIPPGDHALTIISSVDGSKQPYRLFVPTASRKNEPLPFVVVLHGKGVDHNAWFDLTPVKEVAERYGYIVAAPNGRGEWYYRGDGEQDVLDIIAEVKKTCRVDEDRVYLAGHSVGSMGTWRIGLRQPDLFAAICPMAGMVSVELLPNARHLAPFVIHDAGDDVVPVKNSRRPAQRLAELGISFQYREETGYAHSSKMIGDNLPRILDWFNSHHRVNRPGRVTFVRPGAEPGRAYWLCILESAGAAEPAVVDATMEGPHRLVVTCEHVRRLAVKLDELPGRDQAPLEVSMNGHRVTIDRRAGWAVLTANPADGEWRWEIRESLEEWPSGLRRRF